MELPAGCPLDIECAHTSHPEAILLDPEHSPRRVYVQAQKQLAGVSVASLVDGGGCGACDVQHGVGHPIPQLSWPQYHLIDDRNSRTCECTSHRCHAEQATRLEHRFCVYIQASPLSFLTSLAPVSPRRFDFVDGHQVVHVVAIHTHRPVVPQRCVVTTAFGHNTNRKAAL